MTTMLHRSPGSPGSPGSTDFDERRQLAELAGLVSSEAGSAYLAEAYTGWPHA